jgi:hypothetical protein
MESYGFIKIYNAQEREIPLIELANLAISMAI